MVRCIIVWIFLIALISHGRTKTKTNMLLDNQNILKLLNCWTTTYLRLYRILDGRALFKLVTNINTYYRLLTVWYVSVTNVIYIRTFFTYERYLHTDVIYIHMLFTYICYLHSNVIYIRMLFTYERYLHTDVIYIHMLFTHERTRMVVCL